MANLRGVLRGVLTTLAVLVVTAPAVAADYPTQPIKIIVPFAPGGGTTIMARLVSDQLATRLGQQVIIENREGAGGTIGSAVAAKSPADGYTLMLAHSGTIAIAPNLYANIRYDALKDFVPIGLIAQIPLALVVPTSLNVKTLGEFLELARKQPGKLSYASGGVGTGGHLAAAQFAALTKIDIKHVPYRGSGPTIPDLITGRVDLSLGPIVPFLPHMAAGTLTALGVTGVGRSPLSPQTPTLKEAGLNYETALFYGIVAPAGVPKDIVDKLSRELREIVMMPATKDILAKEGGEPMPATSEEYAKIIKDDYAKWGEAVKLTGVKINE